jgi:hypothetical protein
MNKSRGGHGSFPPSYFLCPHQPSAPGSMGAFFSTPFYLHLPLMDWRLGHERFSQLAIFDYLTKSSRCKVVKLSYCNQIIFLFIFICGTIPAFVRTIEMLGLFTSLKSLALAPIDDPRPVRCGLSQFWKYQVRLKRRFTMKLNAIEIIVIICVVLVMGLVLFDVLV